MKNIVLATAVIITGNMSAYQAVAEPVLSGHKNFVPMPDRPIYFRAGNGEHRRRDAAHRIVGRHSDQTEDHLTKKEGRDREALIADFADTKSKSIRWKMTVTGWSLSHSIVVGKKVFAVGEPDFVTCWDLDAGKQLWQRRIMPLLLDGLPEEKAVAGQKVLDMGGIHHCRSFVSDTAETQQDLQ